MNSSETSVLVVDDEEFNLELIAEYLRDDGINAVSSDRGIKAWELLQASPDKFSAVLVDRMMPGMDGIELLTRIKAEPALSMLPVIMQTAATGKQNMLEGLQAGAYYYLTKPYDRHTLIAIVNTAISDYQRYSSLRENVQQTAHTLKMMNKGVFTYQTLEDGRSLAALLANACDDANRVVLGLTELMVNAVEHGNLGIDYEEKTRLNIAGQWEQEVTQRLEQTEFRDKRVKVEFERRADEVVFNIVDQGAGFDWKNYLQISPDRAFDTHGRGIAMANSISFDHIEYQGIGNEVRATVFVKE
jgi:CheY-like chemotaxis protein/anti-sigma regulatory factor (Ser/Thr protein kinase)